MHTSLHKDQRGVGHLALIVLAVVVLGGIGFAGYRVLNKDKSSDSATRVSTEEAKKIEDECKRAIDDKDFCKFAGSFLTPGSYTAVMETEGANGSSTTTLKTDGDNSQMTVVDDGQTLADYITIGDTTYVLDVTDNQWTKYTDDNYKVDDVTDDIAINFDESDKAEEDRSQYKQLGKEDCGDLTCFKYQIIDPENPNDEQLVWFDDEDYLLRKWVFSGGEGSTTATFTYDDVNIEVPSPIKEGTSDSMPSQEEIDALIEQYQQ